MSHERHYELLVGKVLGMGSGIAAALTWGDLVRTVVLAFLGASVGYFTTLLWSRLRNHHNKPKPRK